MMTMITEVFGVHGEWGDLVICPKLVREQVSQHLRRMPVSDGKAILRRDEIIELHEKNNLITIELM